MDKIKGDLTKDELIIKLAKANKKLKDKVKDQEKTIVKLKERIKAERKAHEKAEQKADQALKEANKTIKLLNNQLADKDRIIEAKVEVISGQQEIIEIYKQEANDPEVFQKALLIMAGIGAGGML